MVTPRGKFDLYFMKSFIKIHGQTHNYKILHKNIAKVFLVPKNDGHNHFLIVSLHNPLNQGNTSYPFLIFQIKDDAESTVELSIPDGMKLDLQNPLEGSTKDNIAQLFNSIVNIVLVNINSQNFCSVIYKLFRNGFSVSAETKYGIVFIDTHIIYPFLSHTDFFDWVSYDILIILVSLKGNGK